MSFVPKSLRFESQVAIRYLISGGGQTLLTIGAVAVGVIIAIFITTIIYGVQSSLTRTLTDSLPHVTVTVDEPVPATLEQIPGVPSPGLTSTRIERQAPQLKNIENWAQVVEVVRRLPNVRVVAPAVSGQGFLSKGGNPVGVSVVGADPKLQDEVATVTRKLIEGQYLNLASDEVVIDDRTAEDLNVTVGSRVRLTSSTGASDSFTVAGIYSRGEGRGSAYVTLRTGQSLFGINTAATSIYIKVSDVFDADRVADRILARFPYKAESWSRQSPEFLAALKAQSATAYLISGFSLIASSFAIAAVLIVSVLRKSKQIGILKSMGARRRQILTVFLLEGLSVAVIGSIFGATVGTTLVYLLSLIEQPVTRVGQTPEPLFPAFISPAFILVSMLAAIAATVLAALLPARRAARLNAVDVMR